jgi:threonine dehydrogenase-like Zn-dependent dehydrogenase
MPDRPATYPPGEAQAGRARLALGAGLELAGQVTRMSGKLCIVGHHQGGSRAVPLADWNWRALQIVNGHFRDTATIMAGMRSGMRLVNSGILDPSPLVTNWYPLEGIADAFHDASSRAPGYVKAVIELMRHE